MNRAERRRVMRQVGFRGSKAKRNRVPKEAAQALVPIVEAQQKQLADHQNRQSARRLGLLIPPSEAEAKVLREQGHNVGTGGLILPPE